MTKICQNSKHSRFPIQELLTLAQGNHQNIKQLNLNITGRTIIVKLQNHALVRITLAPVTNNSY